MSSLEAQLIRKVYGASDDIGCGSVVYLKSGSHGMTVRSIGSRQAVTCEWADKALRIRRYDFPLAMLTTKPTPLDGKTRGIVVLGELTQSVVDEFPDTAKDDR